MWDKLCLCVPPSQPSQERSELRLEPGGNWSLLKTFPDFSSGVCMAIWHINKLMSIKMTPSLCSSGRCLTRVLCDTVDQCRAPGGFRSGIVTAGNEVCLHSAPHPCSGHTADFLFLGAFQVLHTVYLRYSTHQPKVSSVPSVFSMAWNHPLITVMLLEA